MNNSYLYTWSYNHEEILGLLSHHGEWRALAEWSLETSAQLNRFLEVFPAWPESSAAFPSVCRNTTAALRELHCHWDCLPLTLCDQWSCSQVHRHDSGESPGQYRAAKTRIEPILQAMITIAKSEAPWHNSCSSSQEVRPTCFFSQGSKLQFTTSWWNTRKRTTSALLAPCEWHQVCRLQLFKCRNTRKEREEWSISRC